MQLYSDSPTTGKNPLARSPSLCVPLTLLTPFHGLLADCRHPVSLGSSTLSPIITKKQKQKKKERKKNKKKQKKTPGTHPLWRWALLNMADDRSLQLEIVLIILVVTCLTTVSARCYTMGFILKRFFIEDYLAILALVSNNIPFPCTIFAYIL